MARCCGGGCSCNIQGGLNIAVTGVGSSSDPFVVSTDLALTASDTDVFDVTISGAGTIVSPWVVSVNYASGSQLRDIPDVNAVAPTNGQVLGWDSPTSKWTPRAPTTAASGSVQHDTSLSGDGSAGTPLQVLEEPNGLLTTGAGGIGLSDTAKNQLVRKFTNTTTRAAASPAPTLNSLSEIDTVPGVIDYWSGTQWLPVKGAIDVDAASQQLLALSGAYANTSRLTMLVRNFSGVTSPEGVLTVVANSLISTRAGVLSAQVTVTGAQAYHPVVAAGADYIYITARKIEDGAVLASQAITGQVTAYVY